MSAVVRPSNPCNASAVECTVRTACDMSSAAAHNTNGNRRQAKDLTGFVSIADCVDILLQQVEHSAMDPTEVSTLRHPDAFRLFAEIHKACIFSARGHDSTAEAAHVSELLYEVMHRDVYQRLTADRFSRKNEKAP